MSGFEGVIQLIAERVLNSLPAGFLLAGLAWFLLRIGKLSSNVRFAIWFLTLLAIVGLPLVPLLFSANPALFGNAAHAAIALPASWVRGMFSAWLLIVLVAIVRLGAGLWRVRNLRKSCAPVVLSSLPTETRRAIGEFQATRPTTVCTSPRVRVPSAIGFVSPLIVLPEWALSGLSEDELKAILLHEFAHLQRRDDWTNLAQKFLRGIFFFHPAVWFVENRLSLEREMACDEVVLSKTGNRRSYAECLVSLAEKSALGHRLTMVQAAIGRARETALRLAHILNGAQSAKARTIRPALAAATVVVAFSLFAAPGMPKLVGFQDSTPPTPSFASTDSIAPENAKVVMNARFTEPSESKQRNFSRIPNAKAARPLPAEPPKMAAANLKHRRPADLVVPAKARAVAPKPQLLLIMQTTEFDRTGLVRQTFCVWRVTLSHGGMTTTEVVEKSL